METKHHHELFTEIMLIARMQADWFLGERVAELLSLLEILKSKLQLQEMTRVGIQSCSKHTEGHEMA